MLYPCKNSLLSGWFVHSKGQAAEMNVSMKDCKLICILIMLETRVNVSRGALQWFCLDLFWVLGEWQPKTLTQAENRMDIEEIALTKTSSGNTPKWRYINCILQRGKYPWTSSSTTVLLCHDAGAYRCWSWRTSFYWPVLWLQMVWLRWCLFKIIKFWNAKEEQWPTVLLTIQKPWITPSLLHTLLSPINHRTDLTPWKQTI